jgi:phage terminase large subunit
VAKTRTAPLRVVCGREYQTSIKDSVHKVLVDQIGRLNVDRDFNIADHSIKSRAGAEVIFIGVHTHPNEIKSLEGVDVFWGEEAQAFSEDSLKVIRPTIRKPGSELWFTWNTGEADDPIYEALVDHPPPGALVHHVTYRDNPLFPAVLEEERKHMLNVCNEIGDLSAYNNIWEGEPLRYSDAIIFGRRVVIDTFEAPPNTRFFYGADWGFANDPNVLIRCFIIDDELYIDYEAVGWGVEIDETEQLWRSVPGSENWPIKADSSRPETISYMARQGFAVSAAAKWPGSVEDGVAHLKGFRRIHIHERCKRGQVEARNYRYKVDPKTLEVLPIIIDKFNDFWDAVRYSLDGYIQARGGLGVWARLAGPQRKVA